MIKQPISCSSHHRHHFHVKSSSDHRLFQTHTLPLIPWHAPPIHRSTSTSTMKTTSMTAPLHSHCRRHFVLCVLLVLCTSLSSNPSPHYLQPNVYFNQPQLHHHYSQLNSSPKLSPFFLLPLPRPVYIYHSPPLPRPSSSRFFTFLHPLSLRNVFVLYVPLLSPSLSLSLPLSPSLSLFFNYSISRLHHLHHSSLFHFYPLSLLQTLLLSPSLCVAGF